MSERPDGRYLTSFSWDSPGRRPIVPRYRPGRTPHRLMAMLLIIGLLFGVLAVRLTNLQILDSDRYIEVGEKQTIETIMLPADRGALLDRNGRDLAISVPQSTVWADPASVVDPEATATALAPVLGVDRAELFTKLAAGNRFQYLSRQVADDVAQRVEGLQLPGIALLQESARFNPSGLLAANVVGQVDRDGNGLSGIEAGSDDQLTGSPGRLVLERAPGGDTIAPGSQHLTPALPGDDLILTIDQSLQYELESALADQIAVMKAKGGMAVVSDPRTGEILAMATLSWSAEQGKAVQNRANVPLLDVFEPGSANKVITMAAALEEGLVTEDSTAVVPDHLRVSNHTFTDHDPHPTKRYSMTDIMATSSNVGTIQLGQQLGKERIDQYLRKFGFGAKSGLDWPNESAGLMLDPDEWSGTSIGTVPIGQGVAVTAVQMLSAYNVLARHGEYIAPKLVKASIDKDGVEHPTGPSEHHPVVSAQSADAVRDMMAAVVNSDAGTGSNAAIDGYTVAGKTGTARKPQDTGTYRDAEGNFHYMAAFAGFVPAENPQLSAIVVLDEPTTSIFAAQAAAPVFSRVMSYALRLYRIPPPAVALALTPPSTDAEGANEVPGGLTATDDGSAQQGPGAVPDSTPPGSTGGKGSTSGGKTTTSTKTTTTTQPPGQSR